MKLMTMFGLPADVVAAARVSVLASLTDTATVYSRARTADGFGDFTVAETSRGHVCLPGGFAVCVGAADEQGGCCGVTCCAVSGPAPPSPPRIALRSAAGRWKWWVSQRHNRAATHGAVRGGAVMDIVKTTVGRWVRAGEGCHGDSGGRDEGRVGGNPAPATNSNL